MEILTVQDHSFKAERAIIMAAGKGNRMYPLTDTVPKPLVSINGTRMIDSIIEALHANGIFEIYVVVGYLKEQFESLPSKHEGLQLIHNPYYESCNNISSLYVARDHLHNCMILDGDQIISNPNALNPESIRSGYNVIWCEGHTDEWLLDVENGIIKSCSRTGGQHGWQLYSISRWNETDGDRLRSLLEYEFEHDNCQIYWDDIPVFLHAKSFELGIYEMEQGDVLEIDTLNELAQLDPQYKKYLTEG